MPFGPTPNPPPFDDLAKMLRDLPKPPPFPPAFAGAGDPPPADVRRRAVCLLLATLTLPSAATLGDRIVAADYIDRGYREPADEPCACNTTEQATHERGDSAFCSVADIGDRIPGRDG